MNQVDMSKVCRSDVKITLTPKEQQLFAILLKANSELHLNSTLRVAGGWVRDKILGMDSHDIDIAIDNMTGFQFVEPLPEWLAKQGYDTSNVGKIRANPDKSKHLETATIRIIDSNIDFVNLRKEEYDDNSRIPIVSIGTPLEDAYRRDLTINSLFYNINTNMIEDFTLRGIDDLKNRIVRTPLAALETFREDPLRILRTIRFATRYCCEIDPAILEATHEPDIESALSRKVSRERVGVEVLKMAQCTYFTRALHLLEEMNVLNCVFNIEADNSVFLKTQKNRSIEEFEKTLFLIELPKDHVSSLASVDAKFMNGYGSDLFAKEYQVNEENSSLATISHRYQDFIHSRLLHGIDVVHIEEQFLQSTVLTQLINDYHLIELIQGIEEGWQTILRLSALFSYFSYVFMCGEMNIPVKKSYVKQQQVLIPLIKYFIRDNLKLKNCVIDNVCWIVHRHHELLPFLIQFEQDQQYQLKEQEVIDLGNLIFSSKELWPLMVFLSAIEQIYQGGNPDIIMSTLSRFLHAVQEKELMMPWIIPSIINGNELVNYGVKKGPGMKNVMDNIRNWMFLHPHGTKEECIEEVLRKQE